MQTRIENLAEAWERPFHSIRARMTLAFAASIAILMLSTCLLLTAYTRRAAEQNAQILLQNAAQKFRQEFPGAHSLQNRDELRELEGDLSDERLALAVLDRQGHVIESSPNAAALLAVVTPPSVRTLNSRDWRMQTIAVGSPMNSFMNSSMDSSTGGSVVIIGYPWMQTQRELDHQFRLLLTFSSIMGSLATLGAWLLVGRTLLPIRKLSQQARAAAAEEGTAAKGYVQLRPSSNDAEVVELVRTLNDLLARQHQAGAARGRFYAAASHELRTPLQALSGHLELALQRPRAREEYLTVVEEAHVQAQRLTSLVRDLLRLHQLEADVRPAQEPVDLAEVCARALQTLQPLAARRNIASRMEIKSSVLIASAPSHADMLARNLLENALLYSPTGSEVRLTLTERPDGALLEIRNETNIAQSDDVEQPSRWLEAFYRPDRSRSGRTGGNGLGLAVCKAVAEANGWRLSLEREGMLIVARVVFTNSPDIVSGDTV